MLTAKELLHVLDNTKTAQRSRKKATIPVPREVNWVQRVREKRHLFIKHIYILVALMLSSLLGIIVPLWIISPEIGRSVFISLPPMLFVTLSWMIPSWLFLHNNALLLSTTVGVVPIRIGLVTLFSWIILIHAPGVIFYVFFIGMMWHWSLFMIPEILMLHNFTKLK